LVGLGVSVRRYWFAFWVVLGVFIVVFVVVVVVVVLWMSVYGVQLMSVWDFIVV